MKAEQFKHNLKKAKRLNDEARFQSAMNKIDIRIENIKKLNKFI